LITSRTDGPATSWGAGSLGRGAGYDVVAAGRGSTAVTNTSNSSVLTPDVRR
jgi:hypothetical protein